MKRPAANPDIRPEFFTNLTDYFTRPGETIAHTIERIQRIVNDAYQARTDLPMPGEDTDVSAALHMSSRAARTYVASDFAEVLPEIVSDSDLIYLSQFYTESVSSTDPAWPSFNQDLLPGDAKLVIGVATGCQLLYEVEILWNKDYLNYFVFGRLRIMATANHEDWINFAISVWGPDRRSIKRIVADEIAKERADHWTPVPEPVVPDMAAPLPAAPPAHTGTHVEAAKPVAKPAQPNSFMLVAILVVVMALNIGLNLLSLSQGWTQFQGTALIGLGNFVPVGLVIYVNLRGTKHALMNIAGAAGMGLFASVGIIGLSYATQTSLVENLGIPTGH